MKVLRNPRFWKLGAALVGTAFAFACMDRELVQVPPSVQSGVSIAIQQATSDQLDLLVLVDNSNSMTEEQANLTANFPLLINSLTSPPDEDGDEVPDYPPVASLQIGVISSDMGTSGYPIVTCSDAAAGDDGVLQHDPSFTLTGCKDSYPSYLEFDAKTNPDPTIADDFTCIATLGTSGCGFEQQLFAVEKALTVHSQPGAANDGFLREEALLAILLVTDEEDCSVADATLFSDNDELGHLNIRCFQNPEMVRPVDGFVQSILGVKPGRPDKIIVAGIVGVPEDLVQLSEAQLNSDDIQTAADFQRILNDGRMQEQVDFTPEGGGTRLTPSCNSPALGIAFPPRRIVDFIQKMDEEGNNGIVQSICQQDWVPTMRAITRLIQSKISGACLARPLVGADGVPLGEQDHANCIVRYELADASGCPGGTFQTGTSEEGHTICQVCQLGDGEGDYTRDSLGNDLSSCAGLDVESTWYYTLEDPDCGDRGKVQFGVNAEPPEGSNIRLECLSEVGG